MNAIVREPGNERDFPMRILNGLLVIVLVIFFAACTPASPDSDASTPEQEAASNGGVDIEPLEEEATEVPATATPLPTATPNQGFPAVELLAAPGLGCRFDPAADEPLLFNALYHNMSSQYEVRERLFDEQGEMLYEAFRPGTEQSGPDSYALTPDAYEVPEGSALTLELVVTPVGIENAPFTGRSTLIYNCQTGQTIQNTFERAGR